MRKRRRDALGAGTRGRRRRASARRHDSRCRSRPRRDLKGQGMSSASLAELRTTLIAIVKEHGLEHRDVPFTLTSGEISHDYMDGKKALAHGEHLRVACQAIAAL